jgi:hypothetical protein
MSMRANSIRSQTLIKLSVMLLYMGRMGSAWINLMKVAYAENELLLFA